MFVDRKELQINFVDDSDEYLARIMEIVNAKVIDNEPELLQLQGDGKEYGSVDEAPVYIIIDKAEESD